MAQKTSQRASAFEQKQNLKPEPKDNVFHDPKLTQETSKKAYYREFKKVIEAADVVLEVLDARDPLGCRCFGVEQFILSRDANKKIILILNKIDLVPKENIEEWLKYLRNFYPTIAFRCSLQDQKKLGHSGASLKSISEASHTSKEALGAGALLSLLKQYCLNLKMKTSVTVGIIGFPNVGKSSLINSLKRSRSVGVGATPGFTKTAQEVHLDKNIKLLDSPGIVFSQGEVTPDLVLRNAVKLEKVEDPTSAVEALLNRCSREKLMSTFGLKNFTNTTEFLTQVAIKRGKLGPGGRLDLVAAGRSVLLDWITGRLPFFSVPPKEDADSRIHVDAKIVQNFSKSIDLEQHDKEVLESLPEVDTNDYVVMRGGLEDLKGKVDSGLALDMSDEEDSTTTTEEVKVVPTTSQNKKIWDDEANNPRINQQRKKQMKKLKKKNKARAQTNADGDEEEEETDPQSNPYANIPVDEDGDFDLEAELNDLEAAVPLDDDDELPLDELLMDI